MRFKKWMKESCVPCKPVVFQGIQALSFSREDLDNLCEWIDYAISFTQHTLSHATAHCSRQRQYLSTEGRVPYMVDKVLVCKIPLGCSIPVALLGAFYAFHVHYTPGSSNVFMFLEVYLLDIAHKTTSINSLQAQLKDF